MTARGLTVILAGVVLASSGCAGAADDVSETPLGNGRVVGVIDGDTLRIALAGRVERVRLIGIDTPEVSVVGDCGGRQASAAMHRLALTRSGQGRRVALRRDATQARRDRYGRLLAYVQLPAGEDLGERQVAAGWAKPYVYRGVPFARFEPYRIAARAARDRRAGVYGACYGDLHTSRDQHA